MNSPPETTSAAPASVTADQPAATLRTASFWGLLGTQLLTAINDNTFRWLAVGIGKDYVSPANVSSVLMAGTACFVLPYLFLAAPAGFLADRFSKRNVIVGCKVAELIIMGLGVLAIAIPVHPTVNLVLLFTVVAMMGSQSALFAPAKWGSIPELLRPEKISAANGWFGLTTVSATVIGMMLGSWLSDATGFRGQERWWLSAIVLLGIAAGGLGCSLLIRRLAIANRQRRFPWHLVRQTWHDLKILGANRALMRVALGCVFFWAVGALAQMNIDQFAFEGGALNETDKVPLLVSLIIGVGIGNVLAGLWSGDHIELGILPLGAFGVSTCSILLFTTGGDIVEPGAGITPELVWVCFLLFSLGASAGLFSVPLESYMQHRSPPRDRGAVLAATNFLVFGGVLLAALLFGVLRYPVYKGSLDRIAQLQRDRAVLNETQLAAIRQLVKKYHAALESQEKPNLVSYLPQQPPAFRRAALVELVWEDLQYRKQHGEYLDKYYYYGMFADVAEKELAKSVFDQASDLPLLTARQIFLVAGIFTLPVFLYIIFLIPQASIRFFVWLASRTVYRIRVYGHDNLPERGGALLVSNHVSWLDGILLLLTSSRPVRIVAFVGNFRGRGLRWLARAAGVIWIDTQPGKIRAALDAAREALNQGELVGIFPEGGMTRTGLLQSFRPRLMQMLEGTDAPIVPVYIDELWGSIFSFHGGRFFWKRPRRWPYPVSIYFGPPVTSPCTVYQARRAVQELGAYAVQQRTETQPPVTVGFLRSCKKQLWREKIADSMGTRLSGGAALSRTLVLKYLLRREILQDDEENVGVLLPPSAPAALVNAALALDHRVAVNLNYTVSDAVMHACLRQASIRHVLTSRRVLERLDCKLDSETEIVFLEDLRPKVRWTDKLRAALETYIVPTGMLSRSLKLHEVKADDLLTVIFTSGSTGEPKGVMLTYGNITSNVEAVEHLVRITPDDVLIGILPFFHSFGYTITMWTVLSIVVKGAYHFTPLDARQVGKLCREHGGTLMLATPTFLRSYVRRCEADDFATLDVVVTGAEKLPKEVADAFEAKFGVRPVEGYGCTETAPLVSVNVPPSRSLTNEQIDAKEGTVGRPIPGVAAKTIDLDSGQELAENQSGMLLIKGPNIMKGYLHQPELTAEVIHDGWYVTGDVAQIDEDGFIKITGRESRFSKIGGEMVPHIQIEEALNRLLGSEESGELKAAVTAVPDPRKGERLIVLHTEIDQTPKQLCEGLADMGLPNIYIPSPKSFTQVDHLPVLGTGKLDLAAIKRLAHERFATD